MNIKVIENIGIKQLCSKSIRLNDAFEKKNYVWYSPLFGNCFHSNNPIDFIIRLFQTFVSIMAKTNAILILNNDAFTR